MDKVCRAELFTIFILPALILPGCNPSSPELTIIETKYVISSQTETVSLTLTPPAPTNTLPLENSNSSDRTIPAIQFNSWEIVHDLAFSPDDTLLAVSAGDMVYVYDSKTLVELFSVRVGSWANRLIFHPGLPLIALAEKDGAIEFRDLENGNLVCQFPAHQKGANSLSINPDGMTMVTTGTDIKSRLWDISSLISNECKINEMGSFLGESFSSPDAEFSPNGKKLALVDLSNIRLRNSSDRKLIALLEGSQPIFDIAFSPDGRWLASAGYQSVVTIWDLNSLPDPIHTEWTIPGQNKKTFVWKVAFSPDSLTLAAGSSDGKIILMDLSSSRVIKDFSVPHSVTSLAFSQDGQILVAGGLDATVWFFPMGEK